MRKKLAAALFALMLGLGCSSAADDKKPEKADPPPKAPAKKLGVGDVAPPLKVTKWLQGSEVKAFANDKVYVIEFWATWCGPCIRAMPHLTDLQEEYKSKGLVVVGLTTKDENGNSAEKVAEFVQKNGKKFSYAFAYCEDRDTDKAYMEASGQEGIPCSFVVGKDGKIAYIGHPMELDDVLPKVLDGTWKGKADLDAIAKANQELEEIMNAGEKEPEKALGLLAEYAKKYPTKAKATMFTVQHMVLMMQAKKFDDAKIMAEAMMAEATTKKKAEKAAFAGMVLGDPKLNPDKKHRDIALKAFDVALQFEKEDIGLCIQAARVNFDSGNKERAAQLADMAIAAAGSDERVKKQVEKIVAEFKGEKK